MIRAVLAALTLSAFLGGGALAAEVQKVKVANYIPYTVFEQLFAAGVKKGFFEGVDVEITSIPDRGIQISQLTSGELQFSTVWSYGVYENLEFVAAFGGTSYRIIAQKGTKLKQFGSVDDVLADIEVAVTRCGEELTQKTFSVSAAPVYALVREQNERLRAAGLPETRWHCGSRAESGLSDEEVARTVFLIQIPKGGSSARTAAIVSGAAQAAVVTVPQNVKLASQGFVTLVESLPKSVGPENGLAAHKDYARSPEGVRATQALCRGWQKTVEWFSDPANRDAVMAEIAEPLRLELGSEVAAYSLQYAIDNAILSCDLPDDEVEDIAREFVVESVHPNFSAVRSMK